MGRPMRTVHQWYMSGTVHKHHQPRQTSAPRTAPAKGLPRTTPRNASGSTASARLVTGPGVGPATAAAVSPIGGDLSRGCWPIGTVRTQYTDIKRVSMGSPKHSLRSNRRHGVGRVFPIARLPMRSLRADRHSPRHDAAGPARLWTTHRCVAPTRRHRAEHRAAFRGPVSVLVKSDRLEGQTAWAGSISDSMNWGSRCRNLCAQWRPTPATFWTRTAVAC